MFYRMNISKALDAAVEAASAQAQSRTGQVKTDLDMLQYDIERLLMITEAIWNILKEKHNLDDSELVNRVIEIDQRDGRLDGRVAQGPPPSCPKCGRTLERKRPFCLYCGQAIARDPFER